MTSQSGGTRDTGGRQLKMPERLASEFRNRIIRGELAPGDLLPPEGQLIANLGVSRPTLREATRILESENLISVRRGAKGGAVVLGPSAAAVAGHAGRLLQHQQVTVDDVLDARALVESAAAAQLAAGPDVDVVADELQAILERGRTGTDPAARAELQKAFHDRVVAAGGRVTVLLVELMDLMLLMHAEVARHGSGAHAETPPASAGEPNTDDHAQLIHAIRTGDVASATRIWRDHIRHQGGQIAALAGTASRLDVLV